MTWGPARSQACLTTPPHLRRRPCPPPAPRRPPPRSPCTSSWRPAPPRRPSPAHHALRSPGPLTGPTTRNERRKPRGTARVRPSGPREPVPARSAACGGPECGGAVPCRLPARLTCPPGGVRSPLSAAPPPPAPSGWACRARGAVRSPGLPSLAEVPGPQSPSPPQVARASGPPPDSRGRPALRPSGPRGHLISSSPDIQPTIQRRSWSPARPLRRAAGPPGRPVPQVSIPGGALSGSPGSVRRSSRSSTSPRRPRGSRGCRPSWCPRRGPGRRRGWWGRRSRW